MINLLSYLFSFLIVSLWLSIPIIISLIINKKIKGYYWYTLKRYNMFWDKYSITINLKLNNIEAIYKNPGRFSLYFADVYINDIGIFIKNSISFQKKQGHLILFDKKNMNNYPAPSFSLFHSFEISKNNLKIKGFTLKTIINTKFSFTLKRLNNNDLIRIENFLTNIKKDKENF